MTGKYFEVSVKFDKTQDDGKVKKITENYLVDAFTFTEGEKNISEEMSAYISGEFDVVKMRPAPYADVITREGDGDDKFWKCKIMLVYLDERTGAEKKSRQLYLVQSLSLKGAMTIIADYLKGVMGDWYIAAISETNILDVYKNGDKE